MSAAGQGTGAGAPDPLLDKAMLIVKTHRRASISLVQRHLAIGYMRADALLAAMEPLGLVERNTGPTGAPWRMK